MQPDIFQAKVLRFAPSNPMTEAPLAFLALGICSEAGELLQKIQFASEQGEVSRRLREDICQELGDLYFCLAIFSRSLGLPFSQILHARVPRPQTEIAVRDLYLPAIQLSKESGELAGRIQNLYQDHSGELSVDMSSTIEHLLRNTAAAVTRLAAGIGLTRGEVMEVSIDRIEGRQANRAVRGDAE